MFRVGDEPVGAVRVGGCQCPRDAGERFGLRAFIGDGPGDAFRVGDEPVGAVRVGGCQCPRDAGERFGLRAFIGDGPGDAFRAAVSPGAVRAVLSYTDSYSVLLSHLHGMFPVLMTGLLFRVGAACNLSPNAVGCTAGEASSARRASSATCGRSSSAILSSAWRAASARAGLAAPRSPATSVTPACGLRAAGFRG